MGTPSSVMPRRPVRCVGRARARSAKRVPPSVGPVLLGPGCSLSGPSGHWSRSAGGSPVGLLAGWPIGPLADRGRADPARSSAGPRASVGWVVPPSVGLLAERPMDRWRPGEGHRCAVSAGPRAFVGRAARWVDDRPLGARGGAPLLGRRPGPVPSSVGLLDGWTIGRWESVGRLPAARGWALRCSAGPAGPWRLMGMSRRRALLKPRSARRLLDRGPREGQPWPSAAPRERRSG